MQTHVEKITDIIRKRGILFYGTYLENGISKRLVIYLDRLKLVKTWLKETKNYQD